MSEAEKYRVEVSIHLTKILVLFGRLEADSNARYLPMTLNLIVPLIQELEELEKKHSGFDQVFKESIEVREKYSKVFMIPEKLIEDPTLQGLRNAMCSLSDPLVVKYCEEEQQFLLSAMKSNKTPAGFLQRTIEDCDLMIELCKLTNAPRLEEFRSWCKDQLSHLS